MKATSRRAVLAGIATAPVAGLPALAAFSPDPVVVAIEAHRSAYAEWVARIEAHDRIWQTLTPTQRLGARIKIGEHTMADRHRLPIYVGTHAEIDARRDYARERAIANRRPARALETIKRERAERHRRLAEAEAKEKQFRDRIGLSAAEEAMHNADAKEGAALAALSSTSPTTPEGISALAAYANEHFSERELPDAALAVLGNIAAARAV